MSFELVRHPLVEDCLARLRDRATPPDEFRRLARRVSLVLAIEATRDLALKEGGLERNEETAVARRYYEKVPKNLGDALVFLLDPMLATGGSAAMAVDGLRGLGAKEVRLLCIVAAPEGVAHMAAVAPGARIYCAALDRTLNDRKYILPGLGDFGDRLFRT